MIFPNSIKKSQAKKLLKLIEEQTRAEVVARLVPFDNLEYLNYVITSHEKTDEIRKLIYGTHSLVELAGIFNIPLERKKFKKRNKKRRL